MEEILKPFEERSHQRSATVIQAPGLSLSRVTGTLVEIKEALENLPEPARKELRTYK